MYRPERSKDRQFWLRWLEKYRSLRCLWDADSEHYSNRMKRDDAYKELVELAKEVNPAADETFVKARINTFRTGYRKEAKKVLAAKDNGVTYEPNWFFYNMLNSVFQLDNSSIDEIFANGYSESSDESDGDPFQPAVVKPNIKNTEYGNIESHATNQNSNNIDEIRNCDDNTDDSFEHRSLENLKCETVEKRKLPADYYSNESDHEYDNVSSFQHRPTQLITQNPKRLPKRSQIPKRTRSTMSSASAHEDNSQLESKPICITNVEYNVEDEYDLVGRRIAKHLRNMKPMQRLIAEKIMCDVCINGRMDQLKWDSSFVKSKNSTRNTFQVNGSSSSHIQQVIEKHEIVIEAEE